MMRVQRKPIVLEAEQITEDTLVEMPNGRARAMRVGDWLVTDPLGRQYVVEQETFDLLYERLEGTQELLPSDDDILAFLRERPRSRFAIICERFAVPYCYSVLWPGPKGQTFGYTAEANALGQQLQRLRKVGKVYSESGCWYAQ
jgi:hypothetical protein